MTLHNADKDRLIFLASSSVFPSAPDLDIFSDPAKSTIFNLPRLTVPFPNFCVIYIIKMACDLEDTSFNFVEPISLIVSATSMIS